MTEQGIERVDGPIDHRPHRAGHDGKHQGRGDAVHGALGHAFHGGPGHAGLVEPIGIAADDRPHAAAGLDQIAGRERTKDGHAVPGQIAGGDGRIDHQDRHHVAREGMHGSGQANRPPRGPAGQRVRGQHRGQAGQPRSAQRATGERLQPERQPANPAHRMRQPRGIAHEQVNGHGDQDLIFESHRNPMRR